MNPEPDTFACEIVKLDPPVLVNVSCRLELFPTSTVPKLKLDGLSASVPAVTPDPLSGILRVGFEASLLMARLPLTDPFVCGANCTLKLFDCPAARLKGRLIPLTLYPLPLAAAWLIFTVVPPEFVSAIESVWLVPVCTFPKARLEGFDSSDPGVAPVAASGIFRDGFVASLAMVTIPLTAPAVCGAKETLKPWLCPAASVNGKVSPLTLNPVPVTLAWLTVTVVPPEFVIVTGCVWVAPTCTFPKLTLAGVAASCPAASPVPATGTVTVELSVGLDFPPL